MNIKERVDNLKTPIKNDIPTAVTVVISSMPMVPEVHSGSGQFFLTIK